MTPSTLTEAACAVLNAADPAEKVRLTRVYADAWAAGEIAEIGTTPAPDRPARPVKPELLDPRHMPRRRYGGEKGRIALLHALAHIELNAIDLGWDIVARFAHLEWPKAFYDDWIQVAVDEALHFEILQKRLNDLGAGYGDLPAHDGLWGAAEKTADNILDRLALIPMTHEARGLDTTPATMARLAHNGDTATVELLDVIYRDEIKHVAAGVRWFKHRCAADGRDAPEAYHEALNRLHPGGLKAPFNDAARTEAGMDAAFYEPMVNSKQIRHHRTSS